MSKPPSLHAGLACFAANSRMALGVTLLATWSVLALLVSVVISLTKEQRELRSQLQQLLLATSALGVPAPAAADAPPPDPGGGGGLGDLGGLLLLGGGGGPPGGGVAAGGGAEAPAPAAAAGGLPGGGGDDADGDAAAMLGGGAAPGAGGAAAGVADGVQPLPEQALPELPLVVADDSAQALWQEQRSGGFPGGALAAGAIAEGLVIEDEDRYKPPAPRGPLAGGLNTGDQVRASRDIRVKGQVRVARGCKGVVLQGSQRDGKRRVLVRFGGGEEEGSAEPVFINVFPSEVRPGYIML